MHIPYIENDATETIKLVIDPEINMTRMIEHGLIDNPTLNYHEDCVDMCNISTMLIGHELSGFCEEGQLKVHEGVFGMIGNHTWLEVEDVIIDATLQQFVPEAPKLSLIDASYGEYHSVREYTYEDWVQNSPNVT